MDELKGLFKTYRMTPLSVLWDAGIWIYGLKKEWVLRKELDFMIILKERGCKFRVWLRKR